MICVDLLKNLQKHKPASLMCPFGDCERRFSTYASMVKHAESGGCTAVDLDLIHLGMAQVPSRQSCMHEWARELVDDDCSLDEGLFFFCRGCTRDFRTLSGLFEHIENNETCPQKTDDSHVRIIKDAFEEQGD